jgi:pyruvate/2-oxoglutarate/acetoin dehydrogenase E1 component
MTYKEAIREAMGALATEPRVRFVGYGVRYGGQANGTLKGIPEAQLIETPVAENLMAGLALGLALAGLVPVVFYERFDFVLNALDAIVNHVDALPILQSSAEGMKFKAGVIFRVVVGNKKKPLFTGHTHTQDFTEALRLMVHFPVVKVECASLAGESYAAALRAAVDLGRSTMLVEYKDWM